MAIEVTCSNGHKLKAKDELAGKKLKCPKCSVQVTVPFPEPATPDGESLLSDLEKLEQSAAHDPLAMDPLGNSAMDPLGGLPVDDWMAGVPLAANPVAHPAPARSTSEPSSSGSQFQLLLFFGIGGGGGAGLALIVLLLVWLLRSPAPATATNVLPPTSTNVAAPGSATQPRSASTVATNSAQPSPPIIPNATQPPREASSKKSSADDAFIVEITKKLRNIALAMHNFHDINRQFPVVAANGYVDDDGTPKLSWRVHLLPYLDQKPLYERFKLDEPWDSPQNKALLEFMPDVFRSHPDDKFVTRMHVFIGKNTVFGERKKQVPGAPATPRPTFANIRDGTSNTILVLHAAAGHKMEWTRPNDLAYDPESPKNAVEALDGSDIQCAMADGEVVRLPPDIDPQSFGALVTANGKEIVDVGSLKRQALPPAGTPDSASPAGAEAALVAQNRKADSSKLKSIGGAILNYSDLNLSFPVSGQQARFFDDQGRPKLSWRVHILPYLDQQPLFEQFKLDEPWDSPNNKPLLEKMPAVFRSMGDPNNSNTTRFVMPTGKDAICNGLAGRSMQDVVDGTGATILVLQVGVEKAVPWTQPVDVEFDVNAPFAGIGRIPETGLAVLFPDGSSLRISPTTPPDVFKALITPAGKERLSPAQISAAIPR